jgi:O-antigen/teichoic acid export membrane protein
MKIMGLIHGQGVAVLSSLFKQGFLRNVMVLGSGTALGQLLAFLVMPLVTRLYTPADLGILQVFLLVLMLVMPFTHLGYHAAIPLQHSRVRIINLMALSLALIIGLCIAVAIILAFTAETIFGWFNASELASYWWLLILALMFGGAYEILTSLAVKEYRFGDIAKTHISQSFAYSGGRVVFGALGLGAVGLLWSMMAGQLAGIYRLSKIMHQQYATYYRRVSLKMMWLIMGRYRKFALFNTPSAMFSIFTHWFPTAFVAWRFGPEATGHVSLAFFILVAPMALVGGALESSFYAELGRLGAGRLQDIHKLIRRIIQSLVVLSVIPVTLVVVWGDELFSLVFGVGWGVSGEYASIICIMLIFYLCTIPMVTGLANFMERQEYQLYFDILNLFLMMGLGVVAVQLSIGVQAFLVGYVVISSMVFLGQFGVMYCLFKRKVIQGG